MSENSTEIGLNHVKNIGSNFKSIQDLHTENVLHPLLSSNKLSEVSEVSEADNKTAITIEQGLDFILSHFEEHLFPRNVSTAATRNGQKVVYDKDRAVLFYQGSPQRQDCKLAVYPNYEEMAKNGLINPDYRPKPNHLFIDLDLSPTFGGDSDKLNFALQTTLKNIRQQFNGAIPTVIWSGGGYHIHLPLDSASLPIFENVPELKRFKDVSIKFMRYAERQLTNGKSDPHHCMSFKSSMCRVPGSINSKYSGEIAKVRIIQRWNGIRAIPTKQFMLTDFLIWLAQERVDQIRREQERTARMNNNNHHYNNSSNGIIPETYRYIEDALLKTAIADYRKNALDVIIIPYLVVIKGLTDLNQIQDIAMQWLDKCDQLKRLDSRQAFVARIQSRTHQVMEAHAKDEAIPPKKWETLKKENPDLYRQLYVPI